MRVKDPKKILEPMLLPVPDPHIIQGVNDRYLSDRDFGENEFLFYVNAYDMSVTEKRRGDDFRDKHTGGSNRIFTTREDALKDAFNSVVLRHAKQINEAKKRFKSAMNA